MVTFKKEGKKLTIVADLDGTARSGSGKSTILATTNGFVAVDGTNPIIKVSLNIITK